VPLSQKMMGEVLQLSLLPTDNVDPLVRSTPQTIEDVSTSSPVEVTLAQVVGSGATGSRTTYFVWEDGSWKHRFSQEEFDLFLADGS
jgi:hypothetical protein